MPSTTRSNSFASAGFFGSRGAWVALAAIAFPGTLFAMKYGARAGVSPGIALAAFLAFFAVHVAVARWLSSRLPSGKKGAVIAWIGVAVYAAALFAVYSRVDPEHLNIDRWSALSRFWDAFAQGEYPYVRTHLGSYISGFPGLFALAFPFWRIGDVGLLQFAALAAFAALALRVARDASRAAFVLLLLAGLPLFVYEVVVRSDLFSNMVLAAWLLHAGNRPGAFAGRRILLAALAWGLVLSTRAVAILPLALAAFPLLKGRAPREVVLSGFVLAATFVATLAPFFLWSPDRFRDVNPYFVQSGAMPAWAVAVVLAFALWLGFRFRASPRLFAHAGGVLFVAVLASWVIKSFKLGWSAALWGNGFDISYFALPMPFLLLHLATAVDARASVREG
jgi:hypothetical protein